MHVSIRGKVKKYAEETKIKFLNTTQHRVEMVLDKLRIGSLAFQILNKLLFHDFARIDYNKNTRLQNCKVLPLPICNVN